MSRGDFLKEVLLRADIVEVLSDYISIKRRGKNYVALCPFHHEKKPSFTVSPDKGFYYCFGCGKGGNAIKFLQDYKGMEFKEAVVELAEKYGIDVPDSFLSSEMKTKKKERDRIFEINEEAARYYHKVLHSPDGREALDYLKGRGLSYEDIRSWKIGYARRIENALLNHMLSRGFGEEELMKAGLITKGDSEAKDLFRDRIIFPISDEKGRILGFAGRALHGEEPKYLNSPETPVYKKTWALFGIDKAWEEIKRQGFAVLVEGYMDVIGLHRGGFRNTVATSGTAVTEVHLRILKKLTEKIVMLFDGDEGGRNAMFRAIEKFLRVDLIPFCILLPEGYDPDDFLKEKGKEEFASLLMSPSDLLEIFIKEKAKDIKDIRTKRRRIEEVLAVIKDIENPVEREHYRELLMAQFSIPKVLLQEIESYLEKGESQKIVEMESPLPQPEDRLVHLLMKSPEKCRRELLEGCLDGVTEGTRVFIESLLNGSSPDECIGELQAKGYDPAPYIALHLKEKDIVGDEEEILKKCVSVIRRKILERESMKIQAEIEKYGSEVPHELLKKKEEIIRELKGIK